MNTTSASPPKVDTYLGNSVERFDATLDMLAPVFAANRDPVIYDIGGYGYLTERIKKERGFTQAYDIASTDLNTIGLDLEDNCADVVLLCEVIEHLYNPDLVMKECRRILKKGGTLILTTPNLNSWFNRILLAMGYFPLNMDISCHMRYSGKKDIFNKRPVSGVEFNPLFDVHVRLYNLRSLELLAQEWGFAVKRSTGYVVSDSTNHSINFVLDKVNRICGKFPTLAQGLIVQATAK